MRLRICRASSFCLSRSPVTQNVTHEVNALLHEKGLSGLKALIFKREEWCPGADYAKSINSMSYPKVGQSFFPHDHYAFWHECPTAGALPFSPLLDAKRTHLAVNTVSEKDLR